MDYLVTVKALLFLFILNINFFITREDNLRGKREGKTKLVQKSGGQRPQAICSIQIFHQNKYYRANVHFPKPKMSAATRR
ncbi:MAG: hypothetical protein IKK66_10930, partial [Ruminococcus sp.]|nr:hypothetical protein [Ruminococcus sp.]